MALTPEWRGRIEQWRNTLQKLCYTRLGDLPLTGFVTFEQLTPERARRGPFRPMPAGTRWGAKWQYAWFRGTVRLPAAARGERIVARPDVGWESRVLVDGREAGALDYNHKEILITRRGLPGTRFDLLIEGYAGHGETPCGGGPAPDGHPTVPEPPARQRTVGASSYGIWEGELYQAWVDVQTLLELRDALDPNALRVAEIDEGLRRFTLTADLELPRAALIAGVRAARRHLRPLLACRNGSTAPLLYCFGHAHIDVSWLWPMAETERKCARTFGNQLALMEEYRELKFLQSQPYLYWVTRRLYPQVYARIRAAVRRGQWLPEGGMWVEADTNVTGGESLIRQFLHGRRFLREAFGVESELLWLPDVFGYSGALPQIMKGCGIRYFSTQKIFWTYNGGEPFPYNTFWWEGIDGTRVLSHIHNDYNSRTNPATLLQRWNERMQKDGLSARIVPFGWGDGGGGPGREHLEFLRRQKDLEGLPRTRLASPNAFFRAEQARRRRLPVYVGELYYQAHRGTYTSQARTKQGNRRSEFALREAELWAAAAAALKGYRIPRAALESAWRDVLLNQFHDILPGSSIHRVYEEAEARHAEALRVAREVADAARRRLLRRRPGAVTAFNSLGWERTALVPLPDGMRGAAAGGAPLPAQRIGGAVCVEATLPPCGWVTLDAADRRPRTANLLRAGASLLENECLRLRFNARGEITSCLDKETGWEWARGPLNALRMYKDVPRWFDAWDLDSTYEFQPVDLDEPAAIRVTARGPLLAALRLRRRIHRSVILQEIRLRRGSRCVEFRTVVDWREKHKLLKVSFPTAIHANEALHEIQFGHLARPNHRSRPFDADRFEVCNHKWTAVVEAGRGAAVLNDCKYGVDVDGGSINLTLLRSPQAPDMTADLGRQEFTYAFYPWNGSFAGTDMIRAAYEINVPAAAMAGAGGAASLLSVDAANIVIETVKPAEDHRGDVVVRLYECKRMATRCTLATRLPAGAACETDMLEQGARPVRVRNGRVRLEFRPFEIKTLRLKR